MDDLFQHVGWARRLARRLSTDADDAEDLLQETWMAAAQRPPTADRPLRPWLAVVLRNRFVNRAVAGRRREARRAALASEAAAVSPEVLLEKVQVQRLLGELVAGLDEPYRQTVILRYFDDLSAAQIARRSNVPAGTVRWRLKTALDELRRRLDARHGGRRAVWTALVRPLVGRRWLRPRLWWALAVGAAGLTLGLGLAVTARSPGGPGGPKADGSRTRPTGDLAGNVARSQWFGSVDVGACQLEVKRLRAESAALEVKRRDRLNPFELFWFGEPNRAAFDALAPALVRMLDGRPKAPDYSLECRTWACRVLLVSQTRDNEPWTNNSHRWLQNDDDLWGRITGLGISGGYPTKDHVSGQGLTEEEVILPLRDPSGARRAEGPAAAPVAPKAPLPETPRACITERDRLRLQIREAREDIEAHAKPDERFARGGHPNPKLAEHVRRHMASAFPKLHTATLEVQCHGASCRARWPTGPRDWHSEFQVVPWFRTRAENVIGSTDEVYLEIAPEPRPDGGAFVKDLLARFRASGIPDGCSDRFSGGGTMHVRFDLRRARHRQPGEPAQLFARFGGTLAGTPVGQCLEDAIANHILAVPLPPQPIRDAILFERFDLSASPVPGMVGGGAGR